MPAIPMDDPAGLPNSYWAATARPGSPVPDFEGSQKAEIVVIGAGYTGLSAALHLAECGHSVLVLDAHEPGWGASGRNNGQVVAALKHEPHEIEARFGAQRGAELIRIVGEGPNVVFDLIKRYQIECDARRSGIITAAHSWASLADLKRRVEIWTRRGAPLRLLSRAELEAASGASSYLGGCLDPRGGAINPLGYARGLARAVIEKGGIIRKNAHVRRIERASVDRVGMRWRVATDNGSVDTNTIIIGTNAYTGPFWPGLQKTFLPARTPQIVSQPLGNNLAKSILPEGHIMSDTRYMTVGVRLHTDGRLHLGGGAGTAGPESEALFNSLANYSRLLYPHLGKLRWQYRWTGFMAMTPDRYPRLFELAPGVAAALGYSGRGICTATILGRELARWATGEAGIDDLVLPASTYRTLPYYPFRALIVGSAVRYYGFRDRSSVGEAASTE